MLHQVDEDYIEDDFNLSGLSGLVGGWQGRWEGGLQEGLEMMAMWWWLWVGGGGSGRRGSRLGGLGGKMAMVIEHPPFMAISPGERGGMPQGSWGLERCRAAQARGRGVQAGVCSHVRWCARGLGHWGRDWCRPGYG